MYIGHAVLGMDARVRELSFSLFSVSIYGTCNELEFHTVTADWSRKALWLGKVR